MAVTSTLVSYATHLRSNLTQIAKQKHDALFRIRHINIHIRQDGRAWQPSPARNLCLVDGSLIVRADTGVRPYAEDL